MKFTSGQNFFHNKSKFYEDECYDFQDELFNFEQILRMSRDNRIPKKLFLKLK
jgi:hypothetical protein